MAHSRTNLATTLDRLVESGRVVVSETRETIAVNQLTGAEATEIAKLFHADGWADVEASDDGGQLPPDMLLEASGGVRLVARRAPAPEGIDAVITRSGFAALLSREPASSCVWVEGLTEVIDTLSVRYAPWGTSSPFSPLADFGNPAKVVRVLSSTINHVGPVGRWIMREAVQKINDAAMGPWLDQCTRILTSALAQEIEADGTVLFKGPPSTRFTNNSHAKLDKAQFASLQKAALWVYENERELENRHALLASEIARTSVRGGSASDLAEYLGPALESARIAYGFGVTQQSKDTLKALADLRKAISDDTAKLTDTTRSLSTAVIGAVFGHIGLVVARLSLSPGTPYVRAAALIAAWVLVIYVAGVIVSGGHYILIQRELRANWREKLYRFLSKDDYKVMVERPASRAEGAFGIAALVGAIMVALSLVAVYMIVGASSPPLKP